MKDSNKHSFEEEFKKVFEEAEATPSPVLWAEIDAHLANQEAARYKRRLLYYKISAAAAVVLLVSFIGLWSLNNDLSGRNGNLAISQQANTGNASAHSENGNETRNTATNEALLQENAVRASNGFEEGTAKENGLSEDTNQKKQPSVSGNPQESLALESPNANVAPSVSSANSPSTLLETTSKQPGNKAVSPAILSGQPTLADNTQAPASKKLSGKQNQDIVNQNKGISSGRKSANQGFDATDLTSSAKNKTSSEKQTSGSDAELASKLSANQLAKDEITSTSKSGIVNGEQVHDKYMRNLDKEEFSINPLIHTHNIVVANTIHTLEAPEVQTTTAPYPFWLEEEEKEQKQKKTGGSKWSVALAFTPSQFDPNMKVGSAPVASANAKQAFSAYNSATNLSPGQTANSGSAVGRDLQNAENFGLSYNLGMNVQYALSEKFSLQSGLQYMHNNSQIVTDNYLENFSNQERYPVFLNVLGTNNAAAFLADNAVILNQNALPGTPNADVESLRSLQNTYPGVTQVSVQNLYQYISVPVRLQYKLIDKKLSTSVGAGVAADVFLKNTIGNTDAKVPEVEFNRQNNNIYKSIGISGLLSARVNYEFGGRYSVYVEPSYRTALSSFTKSDEIRSLPNSFGVGTGFQYRF
ncbi:hypothetical protein GXP67_35330 [Rhodocytophaga rosea]|uniref:Outer membrane beta-barrel protein n=1 Tax=Rhodocytophaga rosea TaxID=2704465 RepID=A0A6C0GU51_9BACT|nr:hypothetical protein [Rhodocytophaga rosea]QHT71566.1 hypothetical protein GXP67_35330 [Rhodocytophaga rosea]